MFPVTSAVLPDAATAVTPELVIVAGLCAVGFVAAVSTVVPSVAHKAPVNALPIAECSGAVVTVCFVTPVRTVILPVTSAVLSHAATAVTPELVLVAGLCAVGLVAPVFTVVPSVAYIEPVKALPLAVCVGAVVTVCFVTPVSTVMFPVTSAVAP